MPPKYKKFRFDTKIVTKSIEDLCDDNLLEIFKYLDCQSLKNVALVSKYWNEVFESSVSILKKFKVCIGPSIPYIRYQLVKANSRLVRKHYNLEIGCVASRGLELQAYLQIFDFSQLRTLSFDNRFDNRKEFRDMAELLSMMPLLENLKLDLEYGRIFKNVEKVKLPRLTTFELPGTNHRILDLIEARNLKELTFGHRYQHDYWYDLNDLADFLVTCEKLKTLNIRTDFLKSFLALGRQREFKFQLKTLKLMEGWRSTCSATITLGDDLAGFLVAHASTLTTLAIKFDQISLTGSVYKAIFEDLKWLTRLEIHADFFSNISPISRNKGLPSVKHLRIYGNQTSHKIFDRNFPAVTSLTLDHFLPDLLQHFKTNFRNIQQLTISQLQIEKTPVIKLFIDILLEKPLLRHVKLSGTKQCIKVIFHIIKNDYRMLKTLELSDISSQKRIRFDFPTNLLKWNVIEQQRRIERELQF